METAAISCGTTIGRIPRGSSPPPFASASMIGPWSVPVLANMYRTTPSARTCSRKASAPVLTGIVFALCSAMDVSFLNPDRLRESSESWPNSVKNGMIFQGDIYKCEEPTGESHNQDPEYLAQRRKGRALSFRAKREIFPGSLACARDG